MRPVQPNQQGPDIAVVITLLWRLGHPDHFAQHVWSGPQCLREKSFLVFEAVAKALFGKTVLISVGGIDSGAEAYRRLRAGASLVQVYTALIYEGPSLPRRINEELLRLMERDGVKGIGEVIGADRR